MAFPVGRGSRSEASGWLLRSARTLGGAIRICALMGLVVAPLACKKSAGTIVPSEPGPPATTLSLSSLSIFPTRFVAVLGDTITLAVSGRDAACAEVRDLVPQYSSSNPSVLAVSPDGRVVASGVGTATLRATAGGQTAEAVIHVGSPTYDLAGLGPPRVLNASYIDLSKIGRISRFRSTVGHSYTDGSETCRSMKHYYQPKAPVDWTSVAIFAPAAGTIWLITPDGAAGVRVTLRPRDQAALQVVLFHVNLNPGIVRDTWVEAGELIGRHASPSTMSDIATSIGPRDGGTLISYFETMTDSVFAEYQARGVPSREAAIITRAERDADPVPCSGESPFTVRGTLPDWLDLN